MDTHVTIPRSPCHRFWMHQKHATRRHCSTALPVHIVCSKQMDYSGDAHRLPKPAVTTANVRDIKVAPTNASLLLSAALCLAMESIGDTQTRSTDHSSPTRQHTPQQDQDKRTNVGCACIDYQSACCVYGPWCRLSSQADAFDGNWDNTVC